jgi:hypothetical protein
MHFGFDRKTKGPANQGHRASALPQLQEIEHVAIAIVHLDDDQNKR